MTVVVTPGGWPRMDLSGKYVPQDYEDLYSHYITGNGGSLCQTLVRRFTPYESKETREDLVHEVFLRMVEKDMLRVFDPAQSNFGGVVFFVTRTVCVNYLKRKGHDPITNLCSGSIVEVSECDRGEPKLNEFRAERMEGEMPGPEEIDRALDAAKMVQRLRHSIDLCNNSREMARSRRLHQLVDLMMQGFNIQECAAKLGITPSTVYNYVELLKGMLQRLEASGARE